MARPAQPEIRNIESIEYIVAILRDAINPQYYCQYLEIRCQSPAAAEGRRTRTAEAHSLASRGVRLSSPRERLLHPQLSAHRGSHLVHMHTFGRFGLSGLVSDFADLCRET